MNQDLELMKLEFLKLRIDTIKESIQRSRDTYKINLTIAYWSFLVISIVSNILFIKIMSLFASIIIAIIILTEK